MRSSVLSFCTKTIGHFRQVLLDSNSKSIFIGVKGGGCNGLKYFIEPTNDLPDKLDEKMSVDGIDIIVCHKSLFHLIGTEIKWKNDLMGSGLEFVNPNATSSCGCGETFST